MKKKGIVKVTVIGTIFVLGIILAEYRVHSQKEDISTETTYKDESVQMEIGLNQKPAHMMQESALTITLQDSSGQPVEGADLHVVFSMPGMFCGVFPAKVTEEPQGTYVAVAVPVMRGNWQAEVRLDSNNRPIRAVHSFSVF